MLPHCCIYIHIYVMLNTNKFLIIKASFMSTHILRLIISCNNWFLVMHQEAVIFMLTLFILMNYPIHINTFSMELSILYFKG